MTRTLIFRSRFLCSKSALYAGFYADDCFEMGRQGFHAGFYDSAISWLELTQQKQYESGSYIKNSTEISRYLTMSEFQFHLAAPAREDCGFWLHATTASLTVRCPQRYVFLFTFFIETRGESETYKKDGTDKDYTTNT
ncbi:hypothetical protein TNCV_3815631 [Trichonephila clavipes]|nr:hypothetical protein TNCV_3815631 [Trichonephila clavipes]